MERIEGRIDWANVGSVLEAKMTLRVIAFMGT